MKKALTYSTAAALALALAVASASPAAARDGRNAAAAIGFGAGALVGAAAASSAYNSGYYGPGYGYYDSGYAYGPGYAYDPVYAEPDYAYEAAPAPAYSYREPAYREPVYSQPAYQAYGYAQPAPVPQNCWVSTDNSRNFGYYGNCASQNKDTDEPTLGQSRSNKRAVR